MARFLANEELGGDAQADVPGLFFYAELPLCERPKAFVSCHHVSFVCDEAKRPVRVRLHFKPTSRSRIHRDKKAENHIFPVNLLPYTQGAEGYAADAFVACWAEGEDFVRINYDSRIELFEDRRHLSCLVTKRSFHEALRFGYVLLEPAGSLLLHELRTRLPKFTPKSIALLVMAYLRVPEEVNAYYYTKETAQERASDARWGLFHVGKGLNDPAWWPDDRAPRKRRRSHSYMQCEEVDA